MMGGLICCVIISITHYFQACIVLDPVNGKASG